MQKDSVYHRTLLNTKVSEIALVWLIRHMINQMQKHFLFSPPALKYVSQINNLKF